MASSCGVDEVKRPHILMFPFLAQGHMIPMVDIAKLLAHQGAKVTIVTTHNNALRFEAALTRAAESSGLDIAVIKLSFPWEEAGLPEGCDNLGLVPSPDLIRNFFQGMSLMIRDMDQVLEDLSPRPDCVVADMCWPWTLGIARRLNVPRISFQGVNCFCLLCINRLALHPDQKEVRSENEYFVIPDFPDRIEITKAHIPGALGPNLEELFFEVRDAEMGSYGVIMNSFEELESDYAKLLKEARKGKVWCVGPASLCNKEHSDKAQRGNKSIVDESECLKWLDSKEPSSVVYVCLGSLSKIITPQLVELGLGLEASGKPFVWVVGGRNIDLEELDKWISETGFEERIEGRGLLIRGWAPQVLILSHPSVGGFLTHCGWNSTLEGISSGLPLITWPLFADQFLNEKFVAQVLKIAVTLGVEKPLKWGEEEKIGVVVNRETVKRAVERLLDKEDEESIERRERARKLGAMAKAAVEKGGSSYKNITLFLDDIMNRSETQTS